jgi:vacuolar-type H+-ATPase subunit H
MIADDNITLAAGERAQDMVDRARAEAREVREGADQYAMDMLYRLDEELRRITGSVRNAMDAMSSQPPAAEPEEERI